ncbi:MAG: N-acetylmuramic acid 6-phosphate etherase [Candidatus Zixiibacteriota bacterium]
MRDLAYLTPMGEYDDLIAQLNHLGTEQINPRTTDIDRLSPLEIAQRINDEDQTVAGVVRQALPKIAQAAELFAATLRSGGRVFYIGAGTSGRLGVLDAAECPPTYGTEPEQIVGVISGGYDTLVLSKEGVEDQTEAAKQDLMAHGITARDIVIGLAASRRTPYTLAGIAYAHSIGCKTVFVICNKAEFIPVTPDIVIELPVGPEAITGSTRMKSGTAQKLTLNTISTTAMVLLGKTYGNLMVDLQARSQKLAARSRKILMDLFDLEVAEAETLLKQADGSVKTAIVMHRHQCSADEARKKLEKAGGFVSRIRDSE